MPSGMLNMAEDPYGIAGVVRENGLVQLCVILPNRQVHSATVDGSMAMMDLLIYLCGRFRLSPSSHMVEPLEAHSQQSIPFQPNTPLGTLNADTVLLKPKGAPEDKARRVAPAVVPEQTIRLAVNYAKNQRAVLRVSPYVPMEQLLPEICAKCGLDARHSELFRSSSQSDHLDPAYSMAQHGIREVYVLDRSKSNLPEPVRLVVNYPRNRKTVVRVQPIFPLSDLLPEICSKCDLDINHVEMFSDVTENHKLDPASCLRELGFYEIFVIDRSKGLKHQHSESMDHFTMRDSVEDLRNYADLPEKENKGILGFLRVKKRSTSLASSGSRHRPVSMPCVPTHMLPPPELTSSGLKKRRAPAPPPSTLQGSVQFACAIPEERDPGGSKAPSPSTSPRNEDSGFEQSSPDEPRPQEQPPINGGQPLASTSQALAPSRGKRKAPAPPPPPPPPTAQPALASPSPDYSEFDFQATVPPPPSDCAPEPPSSDHHVGIDREYFPQDHARGDYTSLDVQAKHSTSEFPIASSTRADHPSSPTPVPEPQNLEGNGERFVSIKPACDASTINPPPFPPPPPPVHQATRTSCNENGSDEDLAPTGDILLPQAEVQQSREGVAKPSAAVNGYDDETGIEPSRKQSVESTVSESSSAILDEDEGQAISAHFSQVIAELETDLNETNGTNDFALAKDAVSKPTVEEPGTQQNGSTVHGAEQVPDVSSVVATAPRRGPSAKALQFIKAYEDKQRMFNEEMQNSKASLEKTQQQAVNERHGSSKNSSFLTRVQQKSKGNVPQPYRADHAKEPSKSAGYSESRAASTVNQTSPIKTMVIPPNDSSSTTECQIRKNEASLSTENDLAKSFDICDRSKARTLFNEPKVENGTTNYKSSAFASHNHAEQNVTNAVSAPSNRNSAHHRFEKPEPTPIFRQISLTRKRTDEVTRDYTPKVGLTTFKVVPSKPASAIMAERASYACSNDLKAENIQEKNDLDVNGLLQPLTSSLASSRDKISSDRSVPALSFADKTLAQDENVYVGKRSEVPTLDSAGNMTSKPLSPQGKRTAKDVSGANAQKQHPDTRAEAPPFWLTRSSSSSSSSSQYVTSAVARKSSLRSSQETFNEGKQNDVSRKPMSPTVPPKPTFNLVGSHIIPPPPEFSSDRAQPEKQVSASRVLVIEGFSSMPMPYRAHRPTHLPSRTFAINKTGSLTGIAARGTQSTKDTSALLPQRSSTGNIETKSTYLETSRSRGMPQRLPRANPFFQPPLIIDDCCDGAPQEPDSLSPSSGAAMFGPVQKFKTVVQKPLPKEASLHSDLMEAIQIGGSDRLKKVTAEERNDKNGAAQETAHDAVLAAIRDGNGHDRLRKTDSVAATEIANHQEQGGTQPITSREAPLSSGPIGPPPTPPILTANSKASIPSRKTPNLEASREALFDAICSGDAAAHLKKVPQALSTFAVNGRDPMS